MMLANPNFLRLKIEVSKSRVDRTVANKRYGPNLSDHAIEINIAWKNSDLISIVLKMNPSIPDTPSTTLFRLAHKSANAHLAWTGFGFYGGTDHTAQGKSRRVQGTPRSTGLP